MKPACLLFLVATALTAQEPVAPTPEAAGSVRGQNWRGYNFVNSTETGYRFASVGGDASGYRSSINYGSGVRVLDSYFSVNSLDGRCRYFDSLTVRTQGLGNDPYESASLRIKRHRAYSYAMSWRRNDYWNPWLTSGGATGTNLLDSRYDAQDHDLILLPDFRWKVFLGFTASAQTGAALTAAQPLIPGDSPIPQFENVKRLWREYRAGNEFTLWGIRVNWLHGWEDFREDSRAGVRSQPDHGASRYWRVGVFYDRKTIGVNGRFTYTGGQHAFLVNESVAGRQIVSTGTAERPVATGNLNVTAAPVAKLTIANSTSFYNVRSSGNAQYAEFDNGSGTFDAFNYQYLGIRTFANEAELAYQVSPGIGAFAGYEYSARTIRSLQQITVLDSVFPTPGEQASHLSDGRIGVRLRPIKNVTALLTAEIGRSSNPFTPIAPRKFHALDARVQYRTRWLTASAGAQSDYRLNSASFTSYSAQSRKYFASGSWTARPWLWLDGSFRRDHLYTIGGIAYFQDSELVQGRQSVYLSNLSTATLGVRVSAGRRATLYAAYVRSRDPADGRGRASDFLQAVRTFPMTFDSPLARVSLRITEKLRWNVGYQYYAYRADLYASRAFRANTGYASLSWAF